VDTELSLGYYLRYPGGLNKDSPQDVLCSKLTDQGLKKLPKNLQKLRLHATPSITDNGIKNLPPSLKHLILERCAAISSSVLKYLPPKLETVEFLNMFNYANEWHFEDQRKFHKLPLSIKKMNIAFNLLSQRERQYLKGRNILL